MWCPLRCGVQSVRGYTTFLSTTVRTPPLQNQPSAAGASADVIPTRFLPRNLHVLSTTSTLIVQARASSASAPWCELHTRATSAAKLNDQKPTGQDNPLGQPPKSKTTLFDNPAWTTVTRAFFSIQHSTQASPMGAVRFESQEYLVSASDVTWPPVGRGMLRASQGGSTTHIAVEAPKRLTQTLKRF